MPSSERGDLSWPDSFHAALDRTGTSIEFGYGAPSAADENSPDRFFHFTLTYGASSTDPGYSIYARPNAGGTKANLGGRTGELFHSRMEHEHLGHAIFFWQEQRLDVAASLHGWDDRGATLALFDAILRGLETVAPKR